MDFPQPRRPLSAAGRDDAVCRQTRVGLQERRSDRTRGLFDGIAGMREGRRYDDAALGLAYESEEARGIESAAGSVRRPFVVNQAAGGHEIRHPADHFLGHVAPAAMLGPAAFVLRPQAVHDEPETPRAVTLPLWSVSVASPVIPATSIEA